MLKNPIKLEHLLEPMRLTSIGPALVSIPNVNPQPNVKLSLENHVLCSSAT